MITTSRILVTLLCQNPFTLCTSSDKLSKSLTYGFFKYACTIPANQPDANNGFNDVNGAAIKAVIIASGWAHAIAAPSADKDPFHNSQLIACCIPADGLA